MLVIGLVGATGAGKTKVLRLFQELGACTVAADELSREVLAPGAPALSAVREAFGDTYFDADGALIRKALGNLIFRDEAARRRLDAIVHPLMTQLLRLKLQQWRCEAVAVAVVESAVLGEMGARSLVDVVVRVDAPRELRAARLQARDNLAPAEVRARLEAHERLALDAPAADHVLINDGSEDSLRRRVEQLWRTLVKC
ncbi:MAG: dephospho-CoA kinase [Armatimonadota bacterium]